jgi:hypothetical protein
MLAGVGERVIEIRVVDAALAVGPGEGEQRRIAAGDS